MIGLVLLIILVILLATFDPSFDRLGNNVIIWYNSKGGRTYIMFRNKWL